MGLAQAAGQLCVDFAGSMCIGVGQGALGGGTFHAQVDEFATGDGQTVTDLAQAFWIGPTDKEHGDEPPRLWGQWLRRDLYKLVDRFSDIVVTTGDPTRIILIKGNQPLLVRCNQGMGIIAYASEATITSIPAARNFLTMAASALSSVISVSMLSIGATL